jgi:histidinol-phosphate aminotransferase
MLRSRLDEGRLAVYPEYVEAKRELAAHFGVAEDEILLTNGTDEAIQVLINTYVDDDDEVIVLQPSYAMYKFYAELAGAQVQTIPYREGTLAFPLDEVLEALTPATRAVLISNPNNPTGTAVKLEGIEKILGRAPAAVVLIDEAYFEFCGITALPHLKDASNLFVSRTFSKVYGMAGMRLGCIFSQAQNIAYMHKAQSPYSVNMLAAIAARAAVQDSAYVRRYVTEVLAARELTMVGLEKLGVAYYESEGNFLLMKVGERSIEIRDKLRDAGVLVRDRSYEIAGCVRVTIGTREQMRRFLSELERVLR